MLKNKKIAIILPAFNEERTIAQTIKSFHAALPAAGIWVINNNSTDATALIASQIFHELNLWENGGIITEKNQGKGNAMRTAFLEVDADYYLISDADCTYSPEDALKLLTPVINDQADMVVGNRMANNVYKNENKRPFHNFGNKLVLFLVNTLFGGNFKDTMSGYRAMSRDFVKYYPILVDGFEIETDMTLHALDKRFRVMEAPIVYRDRQDGSYSKLNTIKDGLRVLKTLARIMRYYRPLLFFTIFSLLFCITGIAAGIPVISEYLSTQYITHIPLAILAVGLEIFALLLFISGIILDSNYHYAKMNFENLRLIFSNRSGDGLAGKKHPQADQANCRGANHSWRQ